MPEINRFRRGDSFEKSRANESLFGASAFAEFLTYMASLREGSRGEEVTAMGGWQWGTGMGPRIREDNGWGVSPRFRLCGGGLSAGEGGWVPAFARTREGIGRPLGQRVGGFPTTVISRAGSPWEGWGWVPAYARTTRGDGFPLPSSRGRAVRGGRGMGPRIREDNGGGVGSRFRLHGGGRVLCGGMGMGPRIREDNGGGRAVREPPLRKENIVGHGVHPHPPSSRGQALTFPHQGGRDF